MASLLFLFRGAVLFSCFEWEFESGEARFACGRDFRFADSSADCAFLQIVFFLRGSAGLIRCFWDKMLYIVLNEYPMFSRDVSFRGKSIIRLTEISAGSKQYRSRISKLHNCDLLFSFLVARVSLLLLCFRTLPGKNQTISVPLDIEVGIARFYVRLSFCLAIRNLFSLSRVEKFCAKHGNL